MYNQCCYAVLDVHGTGELTREQFHRSMVELDSSFDETKLQRIYEACDPDNTGIIRYGVLILQWSLNTCDSGIWVL